MQRRLPRSIPQLNSPTFRNFIPTLPCFLPTRSSCVSLAHSNPRPYRGAKDRWLRLTPVLAFKHTTQEVIDFYAKNASKPIPGVPKFDPRRIVDGQRMMQFLKPLPPTSEGKTFVLKSNVVGVYDKGKAGSVLETESLIVDKDTGEVRRVANSLARRSEHPESQIYSTYRSADFRLGLHSKRRFCIHDGPRQLGWTQRAGFCELSAAKGQEA